jgi:photosystem II Psb27 protein
LARRFNNVAGKPSFSTLYTAINVMAGHYASYGPKVRVVADDGTPGSAVVEAALPLCPMLLCQFPLPEKRRKRLMQEFTEIERNIKRGR